MLCWRTLRPSFQECDVLLLIGDLPPQPGQLIALDNGQRLITFSPRRIQAPVLISNPPPQQAFVEAEVSGDLRDRSARVDYSMGSIDLVLGRERPTLPRHMKHLPSGTAEPASSVSTTGGLTMR